MSLKSKSKRQGHDFRVWYKAGLMFWSNDYDSDRYGSSSPPFFRLERQVLDARWRLMASVRTENSVCKKTLTATVLSYTPGRSFPHTSHGVFRVTLSGFALQEALCLGRSVTLPKCIPQRSHFVPFPPKPGLTRLREPVPERLPARVFLRT